MAGWVLVLLYAVVLYRLQGTALFWAAIVGAVVYLAVFGIQFRFGARRPDAYWLQSDRGKVMQNIFTMSGIVSAVAAVVLLVASFVVGR